MTHSNNYKSLMIYLTKADKDRLVKFAADRRVPITHIAREAITIRMTKGDPYITGFNNGINKAIEAIENWEPAKMRFPSGATYDERLTDEILKHRLLEIKDDEGGSKS